MVLPVEIFVITTKIVTHNIVQNLSDGILGNFAAATIDDLKFVPELNIFFTKNNFLEFNPPTEEHFQSDVSYEFEKVILEFHVGASLFS